MRPLVSPKTAQVEMYTAFETPASRAASSTLIVPSTFAARIGPISDSGMATS